MNKEIEKIKHEGITAINNAKSSKEIEDLRISFLGKKGKVTEIIKSLGNLSNEEKPLVGKVINDLKNQLQDLLTNRKNEIIILESQIKLEQEKIDISVPGRKPATGKAHILNQLIDEIVGIFINMGFSIADGPELEDEYYNFTALNIPSTHPARDDQDSFYVSNDKLLRTHTSPVQIRTMEKYRPPIAIVFPGRCYRRDDLDATHSHTFMQLEGLVVDKGINLGHLKRTLMLFAKQFFGKETEIRFRPDFFPFTEPSGDYSASCFNCHGSGCRICKYSGYIELGGCGMVDPNVFEFVKIDPEVYSGFAFGLGIERLAMTKYQIPDIRMFYENDLRFLKQF